MAEKTFKTFTYPNSAALYARAKKVIPAGLYGHQGPAEACFIPTTAYPFFSDKCKGAYFWDLDGHRFIDYENAYGVNALGYCDDEVNAAAFKQARWGDVASCPNKKVVEFAELLVDTVESADWAFFAKNGSDVCTLAVMTARAHTGRKKIVFIDHHYHGKDPWTQKLDYRGVIPEDVVNNIYIKFNDVAAFERVIADNPGQIACFIATPYMYGNFVDSVEPDEGYWQKIRELCTKNGIVLIIDDVRSGFRLDVKGSDYYYGFKADLITFCKVLANGWPVSALCGRDEFKNTVAGIQYTGSYWMSAVPFAAGLVCVKKMVDMNIAKFMDEKATKLIAGLKGAAENEGFNLKVTGRPSMFYMRVADDNNLMLHTKWVAEMVKRGIFMVIHHTHFINGALTDEDIAYTIDVAADAFNAVRKQI